MVPSLSRGTSPVPEPSPDTVGSAVFTGCASPASSSSRVRIAASAGGSDWRNRPAGRRTPCQIRPVHAGKLSTGGPGAARFEAKLTQLRVDMFQPEDTAAMNRTRLTGCSTSVLLVCTAVALAGPPEETVIRQTGCPCRDGADPVMPTTPVQPFPSPPSSLAGPVTPYQMNPYYRPLPPVTPPPGTLGRTYQLRSRPVPVNKHPRVAMIDVHVENAVDVTVRGTNDYRIEDTLDGFQDEEDPSLWRFESQPLIPGLPHIYEVEVEYATPQGTTKSRQLYVRLIMGRIVELKI